MSLLIKEYLNYETKNKSANSTDVQTFTENFDNKKVLDGTSGVIAEIEAVHNVLTGNNTFYTEKALRESIPTWTYPYEKAVLLHHDEEGGEVVGRVLSASVEDSQVLKGAKTLKLEAAILEEKNKAATLDGRNKTVSIGVLAYDVTCSICGEQLADGNFCEHIRGQVYDDELCYWIIHSMRAKEVSFVNVPSDHYAQVVNVINKDKTIEAKSLEERIGDNMSLKENLVDTKESTQLDNQGLEDTGKDKPEENEDVLAEAEEELIKTLTKEKKELKDKVEELTKVINEYEEKIESITQSADELKDLILDKEEEVKKEKEMRLDLEEELNKYQGAVKNELIKEVSNLREKLGLKTDFNTFNERSLESLQHTVVDLKEALQADANKVGSVLNESLVDEEQEEELVAKSKEKEEQRNNGIKVNEKLSGIFEQNIY